MSPNLQISVEGSDSNYAILLSILGTIPLLITVILCACWKRTRQKDELMGVPGIVIPKNSDENVHEIAAITVEPPILNGTVRVNVVIDDVDSYKRPTSMTKHRRSLPDIPNMPDLTIPCDPNGDNSSDLYATVHAPYNAGGSSMTDQQSSISQPDDPYSRVESSTKKTENPYAVVNENNKLTDLFISDSLGQNSTATILLQSSCKSPNVHFPNAAQSTLINHAPNHPHAPPPLPLPSPTDSNGRISNNNHDTLNHHSVVADDISAALAVRGDVAASQELPYMTPLINNGVAREPQVNFSGDSQDSSKGYTSITVRAPIKDIKASDAADSDDSDGMYQKIPDGNNQSTYTSGSETYEQIQPQITVAVEINNPQLQEQADFDYNNEINAGSSSSSVQNLGSPKPEKRPTNSPLPPTPSSVASTSNLDKPIPNLNDIYAKVNKKLKRDENKNKNASIKSPNPVLEQQTRDTKFGRKIEHNYETIKSSPKKSQQQNSLDSDPGYEKLQPRNVNAEPGYESVHSDSGAALELIDCDPNYEQLRPKSPATSMSINHNHNSVASSITSNQQLTVDGYSVIRHGRQSNQSSVSSDILTNTNTTTRNTNSLDEPNYESMPNSENSDISCDLNDRKDLELSTDYKRLNSDEDSLKRRGLKRGMVNRGSNTSGLVDLNLSNATSNNSSNSSGDDLDPNYESLRDHHVISANSGDSTKCEPNYESVKYDDVNVSDDSNLIILARNDSFRLVKQEVEGYDDGYEKIRKKHVDGQQKLGKTENPDYETIGKAAHEQGNTGGECSSKSNFKDDFFEV